ncbi:MAG: flagellin [Planctomycetota bacterium]|nr:MAG: flagellin [Planctomycetota bacterium]
MARINTNIPSLIAQRNLASANADLGVRLQRLATGLRLNRGADDPAGLIASERLRANLRGIEQGVKNSERASGVIATTEASLSEVSELLNSIKALVVEAANTGGFSPDEVTANQAQIDSAIDSITRISNTASFADLRLLDGGLGYTLSGVNSTQITKATVNGVQFLNRSNVQVDVEVIESAQQGTLYLRGDTTNGAVFTPAAAVNGQIPETATIRLGGPDGVQELTFISGTTLDDIVTAINNLAGSTGVQAARVSATDITSGIRIFSVEHGSKPFVSVEKVGTSGAFLDQGMVRLINNGDPGTLDYNNPAIVELASQDTGKDVVALINGALGTGRGLTISAKTSELDVDLLLDATFAQTVSGTPSTFRVTGGGSLYQLGPEVNATQQVNLGVQSIAATRLGGTLNTVPTGPPGTTEFQFLSSLKSGGKNSLASGNFINASKIIDTAIDEVSSLRGRLGAFERNTLDTNIRSLQAALENVTAANSEIRDADFAEETSALTRAQVLSSAATSTLAAANTSAQNVLQLLG